MKVDLLSGATLDYWVAKAEGHDPYISALNGCAISSTELFCPSTDPAHAYPIIEREKIQSFYHRNNAYQSLQPYWSASIDIEPDEDYLAAGVANAEHRRVFGTGTTVLVAAMRCYVKLRFGPVVEGLS